MKTGPKNAVAPSRIADKFVTRLPDGVRERVEVLAKADHRSMNSFIVAAIEEKIARAQRQELLLDALERAASGKVVISSTAVENVERIIDKLHMAMPGSKVLQ